MSWIVVWRTKTMAMTVKCISWMRLRSAVTLVWRTKEMAMTLKCVLIDRICDRSLFYHNICVIDLDRIFSQGDEDAFQELRTVWWWWRWWLVCFSQREPGVTGRRKVDIKRSPIWYRSILIGWPQRGFVGSLFFSMSSCIYCILYMSIVWGFLNVERKYSILFVSGVGDTRVVSPRWRHRGRKRSNVGLFCFFLLFCTERKKDTDMQVYAGRALDARVSCSPFRTHTQSLEGRQHPLGLSSDRTGVWMTAYCRW